MEDQVKVIGWPTKTLVELEDELTVGGTLVTAEEDPPPPQFVNAADIHKVNEISDRLRIDSIRKDAGRQGPGFEQGLLR